jgi:hypothetical protein
MNSAEYLKRLREQQEAIERRMLEREAVGLRAVLRAAGPPGSRAPSPPPTPRWRGLAARFAIGIGAALFGGAVALLLRQASIETTAPQSSERRPAPVMRETESTAASRSDVPAAVIRSGPSATLPIGEGVSATAVPAAEQPPAAALPVSERPRGTTVRDADKRAGRVPVAAPRPPHRLPPGSDIIAPTQQSP